MAGHRTFAAFWDFMSRREPAAEREMRSRVAGGVSGRVLELGVGVGSNWRHLPAGVDYEAIDPDPHMLSRARRHATEQGRTVTLHEALAEKLPFEDATFDSVLVTLTLCSVRSQAQSLSEAKRVLKPGGTLHFAEHVRPAGVRGRLFDIAQPVWSVIGGGCHPNRRTEDAIRASGLVVESLEHSRRNGLPVIEGVARKPA